jgi:hypothetical protein
MAREIAVMPKVPHTIAVKDYDFAEGMSSSPQHRNSKKPKPPAPDSSPKPKKQLKTSPD